MQPIKQGFCQLLLASVLLVISNGADAIEPLATEKSDCENLNVYLIRHFQKQMDKNNKDPDLSELGREFADKLASLQLSTNLEVAFYSQYQRTQQSLLPSIKSHDLLHFEYDARHSKDLVNKIEKEFCNKSIIIAGHSNTIPQLIQLFGASFSVEFAGKPLQHQPLIFLSEKDYGMIFQVKKQAGRITTQVYDLKDI